MVDMEEYGCDYCNNPNEDCGTCPRNEARKREWRNKKDKEWWPKHRGACVFD